MPNWREVLRQIQREQSAGFQHANGSIDIVRRHYLEKLVEHTDRNVIAYYSGWLSKPGISHVEINDEDKNGFMMAVHGLDKRKGLDLFLHTPGGSIAATQSIVDYLHKIFDRDIRAIVPQIAMSAGTMISCACKEIWMGKHSNLGPTDPHLRGIPAHGVVREFKRAVKECAKYPDRVRIWQQVIGQYRPTFLSQCENAIKWSNDFVEQELKNGMFASEPDAAKKAKQVSKALASYVDNRSHERHIHAEECKSLGLIIKKIESDGGPEFQDLVLTVHHCYMHTLMNSSALKIIENQSGAAFIKNISKPN